MGKKSRRKGRGHQGASSTQNPRGSASAAPAPALGGAGARAPGIVAPTAMQLDQLVSTLLAEDRIGSVPENLREQKALRSHLELVLTVPIDLFNLVVTPLIEGLLMGAPAINRQIRTDQFNAYSVLSLVCQWKFFARKFGWRGGKEIVSMVLGTPGINVNDVMPNQTNSAFFAVKYADAQTLELLIKAGVDMSKRDQFGRTVLYNATEYPVPDVLSLVLSHVSSTETFELFMEGGDSYQCTAPDRILSLYYMKGNVERNVLVSTGPMSWQILGGPPSAENVAECLIMLRQRGAHFSAQGSKIAWAALGYVGRGGNGEVIAADELRKVADCLLGLWLPVNIQGQLYELEEQDSEPVGSPTECTICLNEFHKQTVLYCGHSFCRRCIIDYGQNSGVSCPICRRRLCLDILPHRDTHVALSGTFSNDGNLDRTFILMEEAQMKGLENLTDDQVEEVTKIQGMYSKFSTRNGLRKKLIESVKQGHITAGTSKPFQFQQGSTTKTINGCTLLELSATHTMASESMVIVACTHGPSILEIMIKGVPVIAHISKNSRYTSVSSDVVNTFKLRRLEGLSTKEFRCGLTGKRLRNCTVTCLENFTLSIGDIEVSLRNAVEVEPGPTGIGIQLGQDFFLSAAFCIANVQVGGGLEDLGGGNRRDAYMTTDGVCSWIVGSDYTSETLHYFSHDGKIAQVPIMHFNPNKAGRFSAITLKQDATFTECSYCCRTFPKGMRECAKCLEAGDSAYYCDERCIQAAYKLHRVTSAAHGGSKEQE